MQDLNRKNKQGFTIIEVVLVLAIAGLIFLMVFVALPQLQKSQRDAQRRNDMARVVNAITQYQTNNGGKFPISTGWYAECWPNKNLKPNDASTYSTDSTKANGAPNVACKFLATYLNSTDATSNEFVDPDGTTYGIRFSRLSGTSPSSFDHKIYVNGQSKCDGEKMKSTNNAREFTVIYKLEGSGTICIDNQ